MMRSSTKKLTYFKCINRIDPKLTHLHLTILIYYASPSFLE